MSLSRWDLMRSEYVPFRYNSDGSWFDGGRKLVGVEKGFAVQWLSTPQGAFAFINLHLHPSSKAVRIAQILQLIKWRIRNPYSHLMITGDFNMTPKSVERALIMYGLKVKDAAERFFGGYDSSFCTYCTTNRLSWLAQSRVFDYVFYSGPISILDVEVNLKGSVDYPLSDHYGLKVSWEFLKEDAIHSYDEFDVRSLKKVLSLAGEKIRKEYLKSTELDQLLQTWREQLINKNGSFWNYLIRDR